ncbi:MAG: hypothetical protein AAFP15_10135, partial [Bacteroidota bacterium]
AALARVLAQLTPVDPAGRGERAEPTPAQILLADEPTGNLDDGTGARIEDLLFDLNRERGTALVVVTHDLRLADRCEQVIRLRSGRVEEPESRRDEETASRSGQIVMP